MRKLLIGFSLILLMIPLNATLASANYHIEQTYKDSNGVWATDITFDKRLEFSKNLKMDADTYLSYRINIPTESSVKVIVVGNFDAEIQVPKKSDLKTLSWAKPDQNGTKIISQVLYHGMYYFVIASAAPEGSTSSGNLRIIINPV